MTINLPEINFLTTNPQELADEIIQTYEDLEGRKLSQADPLRIIFLSIASFIAKQNIALNDAAKQNLLYYARDGVLDHKGNEWNTPRLEASAAKSTLRLHLTTPLTSARIIEKDTLVTSNEGTVFFATTEETAISPGVEYVDIEIECTTKGTIGNGFLPGQINTLVKPLPFISYVENITESDGGSGREQDDAYRGRIQLAPEKLSTAGPTGAYEYFAKSASALIEDIYVFTPSDGVVDIRVLLKDGKLPTQEIIDGVLEAVSDRKVRPLTDKVNAGAPDVQLYELDMVYYIETNAVGKNIIHEQVQKAVDDWVLWQQSKIGRDINPSKLISMCIQAGAKRVVVNTPSFTIVEKGHIAQINTKNVVFGGLEDE